MREKSIEQTSSAPDANVKFVRALAVVLIFAAHIFEIYGNALAWWLNAGVQIFLFISGYMAGRRTIANWTEWFGRRFVRILPSYYLLILAMGWADYHLLHPDALGLQIAASLLCVQDFLKVSLPGCDHLWFITLILLCYFFVPLFQAIRDRVQSLAAYTLIFFLAVPISYYALYKTFNFLTYPYVANLTTFAWGYYFSSQTERFKSDERLRPWLNAVPAMAVPILAARGYLELARLTDLGVFWGLYHKVLLPWSKALAGAALFLWISHRQWRIGSGKVVGFIDDYSYEIYLTHHVFIFGALSVTGRIDDKTAAIAVVIALTLLASLALRRLSRALLDVAGIIVKKPGVASR